MDMLKNGEGHSGTGQTDKLRSLRLGGRASGSLGLALQGLLVLVALMVASCHSADPPPIFGVSKPPAEAGGAAAQRHAGSWLTFGYDAASTEINAREAAITVATVGHLHRGWTVTLPDLADERPILVRQLAWPDGSLRDVLYLTTDKGTLLALDAATGAQLWAVTPKNTNPKYTKASPAADPLHGLIYSYGLDGKVHRFRATTGQEMLGNSWPVTATPMPLREKGSPALQLADC